MIPRPSDIGPMKIREELDLYRDKRDLLPAPGAFGYDKKRQVDQFLRRADKDFLDGTGHYANHLRILVEEEYGFRDWLWTYPGTIQQLVEDWKEGRRPISPSRRAATNYGYSEFRWYKGELDEVYWDRDYYVGSDGEEHVHRWLSLVETGAHIGFARTEDDFDGLAHVHEEHDSWLKVGYYELYGLEFIREEIHVLDALADL